MKRVFMGAGVAAITASFLLWGNAGIAVLAPTFVVLVSNASFAAYMTCWGWNVIPQFRRFLVVYFFCFIMGFVLWFCGAALSNVGQVAVDRLWLIALSVIGVGLCRVGSKSGLPQDERSTE